jgi:hypothetical protein
MKNSIDTIKIVRTIRDKNYERTKNMSRQELIADIKKRSADARKKIEGIKVQEKT